MIFGTLVHAFQQDNWSAAVQLINQQVSAGQVAAATLVVHRGSAVLQHSFGKAANPDAVFLLASITKPMTATALMTLVDRRELSLTDPVQRYIPEFRGDGRERVLVRHLLTHTSGLPDMLPENTDLRRRHAPLSDFVAGACRTPLLFAPGTAVRYQSMGILLASEIAQRITKQPFPAFLQDRVIQPLGMQHSSLGLGGRTIAQTMQCEVDEHNDWDWNSSYWRNLASPWGGAHASAGDVARFLRYFAHPDDKVVKPETAASMISNQTPGLSQKWGLGWSLASNQFGKGCSPTTFGHSGSTGTLCWFDPQNELSLVLLTTKPSEHSNRPLLQPVSALISTYR